VGQSVGSTVSDTLEGRLVDDRTVVESVGLIDDGTNVGISDGKRVGELVVGNTVGGCVGLRVGD
jgi:hypothetical protein